MSVSRRPPVMDDAGGGGAVYFDARSSSPDEEQESESARTKRAAQGIPEEAAMTGDWRRDVPPGVRRIAGVGLPNKAALLVVFVMAFTLVEVWSHTMVPESQRRSRPRVGRPQARETTENGVARWNLDRASSRSSVASSPQRTRTASRGSVADRVLLDDYPHSSEGRTRETGSSTLLASAGRALISRSCRTPRHEGRHVN